MNINKTIFDTNAIHSEDETEKEIVQTSGKLIHGVSGSGPGQEDCEKHYEQKFDCDWKGAGNHWVLLTEIAKPFFPWIRVLDAN